MLLQPRFIIIALSIPADDICKPCLKKANKKRRQIYLPPLFFAVRYIAYNILSSAIENTAEIIDFCCADSAALFHS